MGIRKVNISAHEKLLKHRISEIMQFLRFSSDADFEITKLKREA